MWPVILKALKMFSINILSILLAIGTWYLIKGFFISQIGGSHISAGVVAIFVHIIIFLIALFIYQFIFIYLFL